MEETDYSKAAIVVGCLVMVVHLAFWGVIAYVLWRLAWAIINHLGG